MRDANLGAPEWYRLRCGQQDRYGIAASSRANSSFLVVAFQLRVDGARAALDTVRLEVTSAINLAKAEISASTAQLGYQSEAVLASDAVIDSFLRQFEAGRKSWLEVLNAQREALDTRMAQVQQRRSLWQANTRLALHGLYWDNLVHDSEQPPTSKIAPEQTP